MVLYILLGVLLVLFFLCISDFVISSMPMKLETRKPLNLEQQQSETAPRYRFRFVTLIQGVIKAIGCIVLRV
jgi:hypothetical protein